MAGLVLASTCGMAGCGKREDVGGASYAAWGGLSEEEWRKKREERRAQEVREEARQQAERKKAEAARKAAAAKPKPAAAPSREGNQAAQQTLAKRTDAAPKPALPDQVELWQDAHYRLARASNDPRLVLAVEHRARQGAGTEREAEFLARLLQPSVPMGRGNAPAGEPDPMAKGPSKALVEAVAAALGRNGTAPARNTLVQLIAGTLRIDDDAAGATAALKALAENPSPENEEILLAALVEPLKYRPPGQGALGAGDLQQKALAMVRTIPGSRFRARLAQWFVDPRASPELRRLVAPVLLEVHPDNLEAHAILYPSDLVSAQVRTMLERHFAGHSSDAMAFFLGMSPGEPIGADGRSLGVSGSPAGTRSPAPRIPSDPDWPYVVARRLWSTEFALVLDVRLTGIASLNEGAQVCLLAATVPADVVRHRLQRTLERHWDDGPAPLRNAGLGSHLVFEPGFVPVLKAAHRKALEGSKAASPPVPKLRRTGTRAPSKPAEKKKEPTAGRETEWLEAEETLIRGYCQRLCSTALAEAVRNKRQPQARWPTPDRLPVALHAEAAVVASLARDWPGTGDDHKLAGVPLEPMHVRYVRIEEKARPDRLVVHYRRQLAKTAQVRKIADGTWLDSLEVDDSTGSRRSVDLVITRAQADSKRPLDESQELTVEILVVELPRLGR